MRRIHLVHRQIIKVLLHPLRHRRRQRHIPRRPNKQRRHAQPIIGPGLLIPPVQLARPIPSQRRRQPRLRKRIGVKIQLGVAQQRRQLQRLIDIEDDAVARIKAARAVGPRTAVYGVEKGADAGAAGDAVR